MRNRKKHRSQYSLWKEEAYSENRGETLDKRSVQIYGKREPAFSLRMVACSVSNPNDMNIMNMLVYGQGFLSIFLSFSVSVICSV